MRTFLKEKWHWVLIVLLFLVFVLLFGSCEPSRLQWLEIDDLSIVEKFSNSPLYELMDVKPIGDGVFLVSYKIMRGGIFFWEREAYEKERVRLGLPNR